jgi:GNAT superfamily N-acetyltransferase
MKTTSGSIVIRPVQTRREKNIFIKMVWPLYTNYPHWVPPLLLDRRMILDQKKNPFYRHADIELFLAYREKEVVGRIAAIVNHNHNSFHNENIGFFGFFESINDQGVATALIERAKSWLREKGVSAIRGPVNPSTNDDIGVLVEGFDKPPVIMMTYNPDYYDGLLKGAGLEKVKDVYSYYVHKDRVFSEKFVRVMEKLKQRETLTVRPLNMKDFKAELDRVKVIYNNAWSRNWGFVPMTDAEFDHLADSLKQVIDPSVVLFAEYKGRPIGFGLSVPDINQVLIRNKKGRLLPGIIRLLVNKKKINFIRIIVLGVVKEFQRGSAGAILFYETAVRGIERGYFHGEAGWVLEDNLMMNRAAEFMNAERIKTYRLYETSLT